MATAEETYLDASALTPLYLHETRSAEVTRWRAKTRGTIFVTHYCRTEVINAICLASFHGELNETARTEALSDFAMGFAIGELRQADLLWRSALNRAAELSQSFTPRLGTRALDVLHVACALELKLPYFLSFDVRQQKLAVASGLKLIKL